jgi:hypothetical protein
MLARNLAQELLLEYFQEEAAFPAEFHSSLYQTPDGGIAIFPFADDDLVLSARAAALAPERFGRQALVQYFRQVADDANETRERIIIALYGLAALEEPTLPSIQAFAALTDLSPRERLYLGLAAAELGDQDTARSLYRGLLEELDRGNSLALHLTPEELRDLNLEALEGTLGIATSFLVPFDPSSVQPDPAVSISRNYNYHRTEGSAPIEEGDLVRITIEYKLGPQTVDGCYQVSDLLPSGLKAVARPYDWGITDTNLAYPYAIEGQRVSFCVYEGGYQSPLAYYARVIGKGTYTAEPAVIQSQKAPESINLTGSFPVEIR